MLLRAEAIGLVCLAAVLAGPVSGLLARARWPARDPRAALVLWQAIGLGGGLGVLGGGITLAAASLNTHWLAGVAQLPGHWSRLGVSGWAGIALTATVGVWLVAVTMISMVRVALARRSHRHRLNAITEPWDNACTRVFHHEPGDDDLPAASGAARAADGGQIRRLGRRISASNVQLVDHPHAIAYCLPGLRPRVVVSRGAVSALDHGELAAVLAHEWAHARGRHDLVIQPFIAWAATFPFLPTALRAARAVELLVEMLADDVARRTCGPDDLRRALGELSRENVALIGRNSSGLESEVAARASRLAAVAPKLSLRRRMFVYFVAAALVLLPAVILPLS